MKGGQKTGGLAPPPTIPGWYQKIMVGLDQYKKITRALKRKGINWKGNQSGRPRKKRRQGGRPGFENECLGKERKEHSEKMNEKTDSRNFESGLAVDEPSAKRVFWGKEGRKGGRSFATG